MRSRQPESLSTSPSTSSEGAFSCRSSPSPPLSESSSSAAWSGRGLPSVVDEGIGLTDDDFEDVPKRKKVSTPEILYYTSIHRCCFSGRLLQRRPPGHWLGLTCDRGEKKCLKKTNCFSSSGNMTSLWTSIDFRENRRRSSLSLYGSSELNFTSTYAAFASARNNVIAGVSPDSDRRNVRIRILLFPPF